MFIVSLDSTHMKKIIFGKCYSFSSAESLHGLLAESLALYGDAAGRDPEIEVRIGHAISVRKPSSINPKVHRKFSNAMLTSFPFVDVYWEWASNGRLQIEVTFKMRRGTRKLLHSLLSMEYSRDVEAFEQLLHEFVLVPSVYFFKDVVPIHAASVTIDGDACLLAGTGGAGKSGALLALRQNENAGFVSDDIVIMSATPRVYCNMAWPKIYGYNCAGNAMKREILAGRSWIDKAHFNIKNHIDSASVRRKMSPDRLYRHVESSSVPLTRLYYVVREDVADIQVSALELAAAVEMTIAVISAEYSVFHDQLYWEEYNALATAQVAMLTMAEVVTNWRVVLSAGFAAVERFKISIPFDVDHVVYLKTMAEVIANGVDACA
jgi:hypothetical protein